jgi:hypothetical protein
MMYHVGYTGRSSDLRRHNGDVADMEAVYRVLRLVGAQSSEVTKTIYSTTEK